MVDAFLHHDRPIARPADDSVMREIAGRARPLRLGRGLAPLEHGLPGRLTAPLLAVGGHLKNSIALAWAGPRGAVAAHRRARHAAHRWRCSNRSWRPCRNCTSVRAERIVCDAHPGYNSSRWARSAGLPVQTVLHHHAHASALAGEHPQVHRWLVFAWDGVGLGADGTLWGGEALLGQPGGWQRAASFRRFRLPGGDQAGREPWRAALALCWEAGLDWADCPVATDVVRAAWLRGVNSPETSAVGRLFDAAAALTGLCTHTSFEGQGPMWLEAAAGVDAEAIVLPLVPDASGLWRSDWAPLLPALCDPHCSLAARAALFHATPARAALDQARRLRDRHGEFTVGLTGGVFQNRLLTEQLQALLTGDGFEVRLVEQVPGNDAGLAFGQVIEALATQPDELLIAVRRYHPGGHWNPVIAPPRRGERAMNIAPAQSRSRGRSSTCNCAAGRPWAISSSRAAAMLLSGPLAYSSKPDSSGKRATISRAPDNSPCPAAVSTASTGPSAARCR
ncbi:MAG: hypothetical protein MZV65_33730 [Chromatiales bacterium]|nr:hypothetical protein [Chromatiales bacterium]